MGIGAALFIIPVWAGASILALIIFKAGAIADSPENFEKFQSILLFASGCIFVNVLDFILVSVFLGSTRGIEVLIYAAVFLHVVPILLGTMMVITSRVINLRNKHSAWRMNRLGLGILSGVWALPFFLGLFIAAVNIFITHIR